MLRRILGVAMLLIGLSGLAVSAGGAIYGRFLIDSVIQELDRSLDLAAQSLDTVKGTLLLAQTTAAEVNDGLDAVESAAINVSQTISQTRPLLGELGQLVSRDVPDSLEAVESTMPDMAQAAAVVDDTLTVLSDLHIEQTILGFPIYFDLGIDYAPEVPFEESVNQIGASLEGIAPRLRSLQVHVDATDGNLEAIGQDMVTLSEKVHTVNRSVADVAPLLEEYTRIVTETGDRVGQARIGLARQLNAAKLVITIAMAWIGLSQIAPLYLGWSLVTRRDTRW